MSELHIGTFFVNEDVDPEQPETTGESCDYPNLLEAMTEYEDARERIALGTLSTASISVTLYEAFHLHSELTLHATDVDNERRLRSHPLGDELR